MRMSCNGCRVLRKGCYTNCILRQSLEWICTPEAQANATIFLAKFYGRAGLLNLLLAGPENLRPEIFRSLLYEASGRIINPVYGAVGLMWSQRWHYCEDAVNSILNGSPITQLPPEVDVSHEFGSVSTFGSGIVEPSLALGDGGGEVSLDLTLGLDPEAVRRHLDTINVNSDEAGYS